MIRIGIVGHRFFDTDQVVDFVNRECFEILEKVKKRYEDIVGLSAIAEGADTIFAEAACSLNVKFTIVRPFKKYKSDFQTPVSRDRYTRLKKTAFKEIKLAHTCRSDKAYSDAMQWVVTHSDILIAVWNGLPGNGIGGTADAVEHALRLNQDWIHINTSNQQTVFYLSKIKLH